MGCLTSRNPFTILNMNKDAQIIFEKYLLMLMEQDLGALIGAQGGGQGGNWGGSLPKLISLLPMGKWQPTSLKRTTKGTKSGFMSDHYIGNTIAYAADFGLRTTFKGDKRAATNFAISVARNTGKDVTSWDPYIGNSFKYNTPDGFRVQVIWQSNVGGNHYDHVHVGVKKGIGGFDSREDEAQDADVESSRAGGEREEEKDTGDFADQALAQLKSSILGNLTDFSPQTAKRALGDVVGSALGAIGPEKMARIR
jgi:hypothetical protein